MMFQAHIISGLPSLFPGLLGTSLAGRALAEGVWSLTTYDLHDFGLGKHKSIDAPPSGGGAGMVLRADVAAAAHDHVRAMHPDLPMVLPSPRGVPFTHNMAAEWARGTGLIVLCNRFEGVDERYIQARAPLEISLGDYILSGGETAAMVLLDATIRLLTGVMGAPESSAEESFADGVLEYPHYTKPAEWEGRAIPKVLTSGDHKAVRAWRREQAEAITRVRRPDLWTHYNDKDEK